VISYTARRSGLKEHIGPPKHLFSSPSPKPFLYNNINNNKNAIDVKDWMSLVYNPEEPLNKARKPKDIRFKSDNFTISIKDREIRNEMIKFPINAKISPYLHQDQVI
jgi:hypothetical protein